MSNPHKIFIDGQAGTTGLQIQERLKNHEHVQVLEIPHEDRKNESAKKALMEEADITFLCLPDDAARQAALAAADIDCRIIDASSAHRCTEGWTYGMPELNSGQRDLIKSAKRVSNPGCYATGAIFLINPLVSSGLIAPDAPLHIQAASGYSGGGKNMIQEFEETSAQKAPAFSLYKMDFSHKHIPEISKWCALTARPIFIPAVVNVKQGMIVMLAFSKSQLDANGSQLLDLFNSHYNNEQFVKVQEDKDIMQTNYYRIEGIENTNVCNISICHNTEYEQTVLIAKLDNLGKGASGAAVQNMNLMLGLDENIAVNL